MVISSYLLNYNFFILDFDFAEGVGEVFWSRPKHTLQSYEFLKMLGVTEKIPCF